MIIAVLKQVFSHVRYLALADIVGFVVFAFSAWLPNLGLITKVISSSTASLLDKITLLASLLGSIQTNFTFFSASYTIAIAALFDSNVAMVMYYFGQRKQLVRQTGVATSFGGLVSGIFDIRCTPLQDQMEIRRQKFMTTSTSCQMEVIQLTEMCGIRGGEDLRRAGESIFFNRLYCSFSHAVDLRMFCFRFLRITTDRFTDDFK